MRIDRGWVGRAFAVLVALGAVWLALSAGVPVESAAQPADSGQPADLEARLAAVLDAQGDAGFEGVMLVARGDDVLLRDAVGLADHDGDKLMMPETLFDIGSVAKPITALAIMRLAAAGELDVDDLISEHVDDVPEDKQALTIAHVMSHTSGIPFVASSSADAIHDREARIDEILAAPLDSEPGERFAYCNTNYILLAAIIERVTGRDFDEAMIDLVFDPADMATASLTQDGAGRLDHDHDAVRYNDEHEAMASAISWPWTWGYKGCSGVVADVDALHALADALTAGDFLDRATLSRMLTPPGTGSYALGFTVETTRRGTVRASHGGDTWGFGCHFRWLPEDRGVIAVLSSTAPSFECAAIARELETIAFDDGASPDAVEIELARHLAGEYTLPDNGTLTLSVNDDDDASTALTLEATDDRGVALLYRGRTASAESLPHLPRMNQRADLVLDLMLDDFDTFVEGLGQAVAEHPDTAAALDRWRAMLRRFGEPLGTKRIASVWCENQYASLAEMGFGRGITATLELLWGRTSNIVSFRVLDASPWSTPVYRSAQAEGRNADKRRPRLYTPTADGKSALRLRIHIVDEDTATLRIASALGFNDNGDIELTRTD